MRQLRNSAGDIQRDVLPITHGGTNARTAEDAASNLGAVSRSKINAPNGFCGLDSNAKLSSSVVPTSVLSANELHVSGPSSVFTNQTVNFTITNPSSFTSAVVAAISGTAALNGDVIAYTGPSTPGTGGFTINGREVTFPIVQPGVATPSIVGPINGATDQLTTLMLYGSTFTPVGGTFTHQSSDWQIATDSGFTNIAAQTTGDVANLTSWSPAGLHLAMTYYARVRYNSTEGPSSAWSDSSSFTTRLLPAFPSLEQAKLVASDKAASDYFGYSVSLSADGNTALINAYMANPSGLTDAGAAYVYTRTGSTWTQQAKLVAGDLANSDYFGVSVSMSADGNTVLIGASGANIPGFADAGAAYVFTRSGSTWTQQAKLTASDKAVSDWFGWSVAISGDGYTAIIGADGAGPSGVYGSGAAYIFTRSGSTWTQQAKLVASDIVPNAQFGYSVAINRDGSTAIVGSNVANAPTASFAGASYVYTRTGSTWTQQAKLAASDAVSSDFFGISVSLSSDGNTALVGAYAEDPSGTADAGAAYVFTRLGTVWTQKAKLIASDKAISDFFGYSVSLSSDGNTALIGAFTEDPSGINGGGAAYVFTYSGTAWSQQVKLTASDKAASDYFGVSVSLSGDGSTALIGAYNASPSGIASAGAAYIYN